MAEISHPHADQPWPESRWRQAARYFFATGVFSGDDNELAVSDGGGLDVAVATGRALVDGFEYVNTSSTTVTLDTADPSNDRIDLVVLEYDPDGSGTAGQGTVRLDKVTGTPAASPSAPSPTQADAGIFQYVLAEVTVPAGSASLGTIKDRRDLSEPPTPFEEAIDDAYLTNDTVSATSTAEQWGTEEATVPDPDREVSIAAVFTGRAHNTSATSPMQIQVHLELSTDGGSTWTGAGTGDPGRQLTVEMGANNAVAGYVPLVTSIANTAVTPTGEIQVRAMIVQNDGSPGDVDFENGHIVLFVS